MEEKCTNIGHVQGMLDRDQRTAKMCCYERGSVLLRSNEEYPQISFQNKAISHRESNIPRSTSPHSSCKTRINRHFWNNCFQRLKHALIVGTYISLVTFPSISSAPTKRHDLMSSRMDSHPKWINPCGSLGSGVAPGSPGTTTEMPQISEKEILSHITAQAKISLSKATQNKDRFLEKTQIIEDKFKDFNYDWLLPKETIPKKLGESINDQAYLKNLDLQKTMKDVYRQLQMIAVGLEQMVWDEEDRDGQFKTEFSDAEGYLRSLLCEIQMALVEFNFTQHPDITRDVMTEKYRTIENNNTASINIRNWIIYRDYMNMLEYVIEVFQHFEKNS